MPTYKTPGVYIEETGRLPPSVAGVATAVPAFIGFTEQAIDEKGNDLTRIPTRVTSLLEYEHYFGRAPAQSFSVDVVQRRLAVSGAIIETKVNFTGVPPVIPAYLLYYSMQLFFANGGGACYVVSIGDTGTTVFDTELFVAAIRDLEKCDEPSLYVFPDACSHRVGAEANDAGVACIVNAALESCARMKDRFTIADVRNAVPGGTITIADIDRGFRNRISSSSKILRYGAAYFPYLETSLGFIVADSHVRITSHAVIDIAADGKESSSASPIDAHTPLTGIAGHPDIGHAVRKFIHSNARVTLPPSGAIAGIYTQVDTSRGVWKAPANIAVAAIVKPALAIDNDFGAALNTDTMSGKSINVIRTFAGKGTLVWGARTLAGNDNEWRYIPVRRFCNFVEESVAQALEAFAFELNDANAWVSARAMIENFLNQQWRQGALMGSKPDEAFYVRTGLGQTMTANDVAEGRMIVEIGLAVVRPAEFVILRIVQKTLEA